MKICSRCKGEPQPLENFGVCRRNKDGLSIYCKACNRTASAASKAKHGAKSKEANRKNALLWSHRNRSRHQQNAIRWAKENPAAAKAKGHKRRAIKMKAPGSFTAAQWEVVKARQGYKCLRCGRKEPEITLTIDHRIPLSKGGTNYISNIDGLCLSCNSSKGAKI